MQLDFLQDEAQTLEKTTSPKKVKRPQKHFPVLETKVTEQESAELPALPQSLRPPFIMEDTDEGEEAIEKAPGAFKTISETAKFLDVPQHVLRFWESRFSQIKPLKLNGGRRYYRPQDIDILSTIKNLLYKQGYTIKGAKKAFQAEKRFVLPVAEEVMLDAPVMQDREQLICIRKELMDLRDSLLSHLTK